MIAKLVILFAAVGISILVVISIISHPVSISSDKLQNYYGREVVVSGVVIERYETNNGNTLLRLHSDNITVPVFVLGVTPVAPGDEIRVIGRVQYYGSEYEIVVSDCKNIEITKQWSSTNISIVQLKYQAEKYVNTNVNVTGYACSVTSSGFTLVDSINNCKSSIKVIFRKSVLVPTERSTVYVRAELLYDTNSFSYFLNLESNYHGVGIIID